MTFPRSREGPLRHAMTRHSVDKELGAKVISWIAWETAARRRPRAPPPTRAAHWPAQFCLGPQLQYFEYKPQYI